MNEQQDREAMDALLAGPRGRRLLLEYARESESQLPGEPFEGSLNEAVFSAAQHLNPDKNYHRYSTITFWTGPEPPEIEAASPEDVAKRLMRVELAQPTPDLLLGCLSLSVGAARYWQEPDGEDILAATPPVKDALTRVADHLAASAPSEATKWWQMPVQRESQWAVQWDKSEAREVVSDPGAVLSGARDAYLAAEWHAVRDMSEDPTASLSGDWWSIPTQKMPSSTRALPDGSPVGLWLVEDGMGWTRAETRQIAVSPGIRILEIDTAKAWAELCARFPLEQTGQKRHDWHAATGRTGRWVVPDWAAVAAHYEGVHLQVSAYLAAAGTAIAVDSETATVIAGWNPDETYWFTPRISYLNGPVEWMLERRLDEGKTEDFWVRR